MFSLRPLASGSRIAARSLVKPPPRVARTFTSSLSLRSNTHERDQGATGPGQRAAPSGPSGKVPDAELSDPYPLPFSPDVVDLNNADSGPETARHAGVNLASDSQGVDGVTAPMRVPGREGEDRNTKVARLVYQCRKRGTLETDLLLSTFAKKELRQLPDKELDELDMLLDEPDWDIFYWCTKRKPVPERWEESFTTEGRLGHRLRVHTRNDERTVRWMPEL